MSSFRVKEVRGGEPILADDWNYVQNGIKNLEEMVLKMTEGVTLVGVASPIGVPLDLDVVRVEDEGGRTRDIRSFGTRVVGMITKQWVVALRTGIICRFDVNEKFDRLSYWATEESGGKKPLRITLEYETQPGRAVEREVYSPLYVNDIRQLSEKNPENEWQKAAAGPTGLYWYEYIIENRRPDTLVKQVWFENINENCITRIGNVLHIRSKIRLLDRKQR